MSYLANSRRSLGKFLRYAFMPNLSRSLEPAAKSYFNFGRVLAHVFSTVGLIAKSHPWLRSSALPRPLEVMSYVCARTEWRRPFAVPTVLAAAVTLFLACGSIAALSAITTTAIGASQAYAGSMFTAPSPGTDLALKYMSNSFGIEIDSVPMATLDSVVKGFQQIMALYSTAMLVIAGFILLYIVVAAVASTAHEGRVGGSGFNQIWAPIRLIVAIGLLVPLPMAGGYNGYNSGQYIVMNLAALGSSLASNIWVPFATALADKKDLIATPSLEPAASAVRGTMENEFCMVRYEALKTYFGYSDVEALPVTPQSFVNGGLTTIYYTTKGADSSAYCGSTQYEKTTATNTISQSISTDFEKAFKTMQTSVRNLAVKLNDPTTYLYFDQSPPDLGREDVTMAYFAKEFSNIIIAYQTDLANAIDSAIKNRDTVSTNEIKKAVTDQGWAGAGLWFNTIARLNSEVMTASRGMPTSKAPSLVTPGNPTGKDPCALLPTELMSCKVEEGLKFYNKAADAIPLLYPSLGYSASKGQGTVGSVFTPAVSAGLTNDSSYAGIASGFIGQTINTMMTETFVGGPFGTIGIGADAAISQTNPLAQLAQIGDWMINKCLILFGLAAFAPGGLSIVIVSLAMLGFGAGLLLMYVTPLMPFIRFLFNIAGWLLNILEAVVAIPLVAVAHLSTKGEGISGDMARTTYFMVLSIFLRPSLMVVGLIAALMMFTLSIGILNDMYKTAVTGFMGTAVGNAGGGFSIIIYTVIYVAMAYGLCNLCFKLIEEIPNHAMNWISQSSARAISQDEGVASAVTQSGTGFIGVARDSVRGISDKVYAPKK